MAPQAKKTPDEGPKPVTIRLARNIIANAKTAKAMGWDCDPDGPDVTIPFGAEVQVLDRTLQSDPLLDLGHPANKASMDARKVELERLQAAADVAKHKFSSRL